MEKIFSTNLFIMSTFKIEKYMKKLILTLMIISLVLTIIGGSAYAGEITPGSSYPTTRGQDCTVWREGMTKDKNIWWCGSGTGYGSEDTEQYKRIYELELAVMELQQKQTSCTCTTESGQPTGLLELRIQTLEQKVDSLQKSISNALQSIITILLNRK